MKPIRSRLARWFSAVSLTLLLGPALADPPARVGRLAEVAGQVWIYDDAAGEWIAAARNRPITSGDRLSTERGARAEVQVGSVTWRLDANTEIEVQQLDDAAIRLQLHSGSVALRVRNREAAREVELLTGEGRFAPQRAGHFRIDRDDDVSAATVWSGTLDFRSDDSELDVQAGQRTEFWRDGGRTHFSRLVPARDAFADWAIAEDARASERSASSRHISPEMPGAEDLDRHGHWERSSEYGSLWVPYHVAPGWAPYRYGHWAHVGRWGWSWVDDAPWGFAPFHYGRWLHHGGRWCWAPGSYVARPVYAPALVAWIGGPRVSLSVNVGSPHAVGWFPLGPREIYVPTYRVSPVYIRSVNVTHVTHVPSTIIHQPTMAAQQTRYVNRHVHGAVTAVAPDVIRRRQPVAPHVNPGVVRQIESQPVSVSLPVAALAARREVNSPAAGGVPTPRMLPPPPNRIGAEPRVLRPRFERPVQAQLVPQPAAPVQPVQPSVGPGAAVVPVPRAAVLPPQAAVLSAQPQAPQLEAHGMRRHHVDPARQVARPSSPSQPVAVAPAAPLPQAAAVAPPPAPQAAVAAPPRPLAVASPGAAIAPVVVPPVVVPRVASPAQVRPVAPRADEERPRNGGERPPLWRHNPSREQHR